MSGMMVTATAIGNFTDSHSTVSDARYDHANASDSSNLTDSDPERASLRMTDIDLEDKGGFVRGETAGRTTKDGSSNLAGSDGTKLGTTGGSSAPGSGVDGPSTVVQIP